MQLWNGQINTFGGTIYFLIDGISIHDSIILKKYAKALTFIIKIWFERNVVTFWPNEWKNSSFQLVPLRLFIDYQVG